MGINLPGARNVFLPSLPPSVREVSEIATYLKDFKAAVEKEFSKSFDNTYTILSTGTSGTFKSSAGDTITIVNGIVTALA